MSSEIVFDYIIVGAGSAGCVLAGRLTEDAHTNVLLLEAGGPDKRLEFKIPAAFSKLFKSSADWDYYTEPQPYLNDRKLYWPRGRVLGGSSAINAMIYVRGHRLDYDRWAEQGNKGWSYEDILPYFKRMENQARGASCYHGVGGPLYVADLRTVNPLTHRFIAAAVELGFFRNNDFNGGQQDGFGVVQVTQKNGRRHSAADAYLKPALKRPNLTLITHAHATRILLDGRRATGVEYMHGDRLMQAQAGREVILAGGAINSPQLLMLSGIGPGDHLQDFGISVVIDLPGVGQNLQDHPVAPFVFESALPITLDKAETAVNLARYLLFRRGPLASNVAEACGFIRTCPDLPAPNIQFHFGPVYFLEHGQYKPPGYGISIGPTLIRPQSRGCIRLKSDYPFLPPAIQPNYFERQADLEAIVAGLKIARQLMDSRAFDRYRGPEFMPGRQVQSDEEWREYARQTTETLYHPVGTCKMGRDPLAVVDDRLCVHGVAGLRVVDASIMPTIVAGNTNAPVMMIAEKAADLIREFSISQLV